jgi:hydrogenase maturation protein HypF
MKLTFYGVVQGVGFRPTVYRIAKALGCRGYVRNCGANVEVWLDKNVDKFIEMLYAELPTGAEIHTIKREDISEPVEPELAELCKSDEFVIVRSRNGTRESPIPPDIAICNQCLDEMFDQTNRRYMYPFTNCTICGARFSIITAVPYDRVNTAMHVFNLCATCKREESTPTNRRFYAQTISCPSEGLTYKLYDSHGKVIDTAAPIKTFAEYIDGGHIGVMKAWGGMHIVCALSATERLRSWYSRPEKPFAVMVRDLDAVKRYAYLNENESSLLVSAQRPIVLLRKRYGISNEQDRLLDIVSPGLDTIGIYLPYTGAQHILFHHLQTHDAVVMTSANPPGEPMVIENHDAFKLNADYYLLHNRAIINRVDDSVVIPYEHSQFFIRRSRGYVPVPLNVAYDTNIISVGAEENVVGAITVNNMLYTTQYIGDADHYGVTEFLESSLRHLAHLFDLKAVDGIGIDLHPQYRTRAVGKRLAVEFDAQLVEVQHHWAHAVSLIIDNFCKSRTALPGNVQSEPVIALAWDGTGYGADDTLWGAEVLRASCESYTRVGTIEPLPLIGGDAAVRDPRRLVFGIYEQLGYEPDYFDSVTSAIFMKLLTKSVRASSMGRVLDAISCRLGICSSRTYEGEPAMKLERYLASGERKYEFNPSIVTDSSTGVPTVAILPLFAQLEDHIKAEGYGKGDSSSSFIERIALQSPRFAADLAYSMVYCIVENLVNIAMEAAETYGTNYIGITGGVSYNIPIVNVVRTLVINHGLKLLTHSQIPNGDGGIAVGQNAIVGYRLC